MMHKRILVSALALILLLSLCGCSKPVLYTSERLETEIKGEGSRALTITLMGPDNSLYPSTINNLEEDEYQVYSIKKQKIGEDYIKLKLTANAQGMAPLIVTYTDGDEIYALLNVSVIVDGKNKLTTQGVVVSGEAAYESLGEEMPEGSQISTGEYISKLITLTSADGPWVVDSYDEQVLSVDAYVAAGDSENYEFLVTGLANGSGSVDFINRFLKQRVSMSFEVVNVVDGSEGEMVIKLVDRQLKDYVETESAEYKERLDVKQQAIQDFSPDVYVPASAVIKGSGSSEGYLDISLEMGDNKLGYYVFSDISLEDDLAEWEDAFPAAKRDSFETAQIKVELFQIEDYSVAVWEKDGLTCELYMFDEGDIVKAGNIVEAFLSDTAL